MEGRPTYEWRGLAGSRKNHKERQWLQKGRGLGDSFTEAWASNLADPVVLKITIVEKDTVASAANHKGGATRRPEDPGPGTHLPQRRTLLHYQVPVRGPEKQGVCRGRPSYEQAKWTQHIATVGWKGTPRISVGKARGHRWAAEAGMPHVALKLFPSSHLFPQAGESLKTK